MNKGTAVLSAAIMALAFSQAIVAADAPFNPDDTPEQIAEIRARIAQLEAAQKQADARRLDAENKLEAKITADELSTRAHESDHFLTAEGFTAGYTDGRFVIQSVDGNFLLHPWFHLQIRDVTLLRNSQLGPAKDRYDEVDNGFEIRQLRFGFDGNLFSPGFTYFVNWATQRTSSNVNVSGATPAATGGKVTASNSLGGGLVLQQAWAKYRVPDSSFFLKLGEIKDPLLHEQIVDTRFQQGAERSISADIFANGDDFTEGATVIYDPGQDLKIEAGVNHGMRGANTNFLDYPNNGAFNQFDYGLVGRVEYKVMGRWKD